MLPENAEQKPALQASRRIIEACGVGAGAECGWREHSDGLSRLILIGLCCSPLLNVHCCGISYKASHSAFSSVRRKAVTPEQEYVRLFRDKKL